MAKNMKKLMINGVEYELVDGGARGLIATNASGISTLQTNLTTAQGNITTLQGKVSDLESDVIEIQGEFQALDDKVDNLPVSKVYELQGTYNESDEKLTINLKEV